MKPIPIKLTPLTDESPSSWIIRLSKKYGCSVDCFLSYYGLDNLLKEGIDIDADLLQLSSFIPRNNTLPITVAQKLRGFQWIKGSSNWLHGSNRRGSVYLNSFTQVCSNCLKQKGYYQLKWRFFFFFGCVDCETRLLQFCPKCKKEITLREVLKSNSKISYCFYCHFDLTLADGVRLSMKELDVQRKILRSYSESPPNWSYLEFILFLYETSPKENLVSTTQRISLFPSKDFLTRNYYSYTNTIWIQQFQQLIITHD